MAKLFPTVVKPAELKAVVRIIKENGGSIQISRLSKTISKNIDELLPLLDASVMLGIAKLDDGNIVLTEQGRRLTQVNIDTFIEKKISVIEPFKSIIAILKKEGALSSTELSELLKERGIALHAESEINTALLREALYRWAISYHMLNRNARKGAWGAR